MHRRSYTRHTVASLIALACARGMHTCRYRFLISDLMPFGRRAVIGIEHGGTDESAEHYETAALWYVLYLCTRLACPIV